MDSFKEVNHEERPSYIEWVEKELDIQTEGDDEPVSAIELDMLQVESNSSPTLTCHEILPSLPNPRPIFEITKHTRQLSPVKSIETESANRRKAKMVRKQLIISVNTQEKLKHIVSLPLWPGIIQEAIQQNQSSIKNQSSGPIQLSFSFNSFLADLSSPISRKRRSRCDTDSMFDHSPSARKRQRTRYRAEDGGSIQLPRLNAVFKSITMRRQHTTRLKSEGRKERKDKGQKRQPRDYV